MKYQIEKTFPVEIYASDRITMANQFRQDVIGDYKQMYENFWGLNREEVDMEAMQRILDRLGIAGLEILQDAGKYVEGIVTAFPDELDKKYHSSPYEYTSEAPGRIVLQSLKEAWQPEEPETPQEQEP